MRLDCNDIFEQLESWYARENGKYLMQAARDATQEVLDTSFGYHILQLGLGGERALCEGSPINHRVYCADNQRAGIGLVAEPDELPLESDSIDTVIAHHCLEFAANPHQVLREIQRVFNTAGPTADYWLQTPIVCLGVVREYGVRYATHCGPVINRLVNTVCAIGCTYLVVRYLIRSDCTRSTDR